DRLVVLVAHQEPHPEPAEYSGARAARMVARDEARDARPHGIAHDIGARYAEMIHELEHVLAHLDQRIIAGRIEFLRFAMSAIVEGDDAPPVARERLRPQRVAPVHRMVRGEAVHEHDRLVAIFGRGPKIDEGEARAARAEDLHDRSAISPQTGEREAPRLSRS